MEDNDDREVDTDQLRLTRILKRFWISLIAAPVLWTIACMIILIPFGNGQNLAGVLVFIGYPVIFVGLLLATFAIALFVLIKRKTFTRKQIISGLLPMIVFFHLLVLFLVVFSTL